MIQNNNQPISKIRDSNLELFRIITMLLIVAHHYVVNSGLMDLIKTNPFSNQSIFLLIFGAWGKVGINCFVLITGYFMCKSKITIIKFLKLYFEIIFYGLITHIVFLITGYEVFNIITLIKRVIPFCVIKDNFAGCFLIFYLTIPFLNILLNNITQKQFKYLLALTLIPYTLFSSIPKLGIQMNYVEWFCVLYFIGSYIRMHPHIILESKKFRNTLLFCNIILAILSIVVLNNYNKFQYYFLVDSNKILALTLSISAFIYFKYLKINNSNLINVIASTTFGVMLLHSCGDSMRQWLWKDFLNNVGQYGTNNLYIHAILSVICIFIICSLIDFIRIKLLEQPLFNHFSEFFKKLVTKPQT